MVIFMLTCIPLVYLLLISSIRTGVDAASAFRNPLLAGALGYIAFLALQMLLQFAVGAASAPDYRLGAAFHYFALDSLLWPFSFATLCFCFLFRKKLAGDKAGMVLAFRSFLASFLFLLSIQDLIMSLSFLSPVELWLLPTARAIWFVLLSLLLSEWRSPRKLLVAMVLGFFAVQLLVALGLAFAWISQALPATICLALPLAATILLVALPPGLIERKLHPAGV